MPGHEKTRVAIFGGLSLVSRRRLAQVLARRKACAARHISGNTSCVVIGHGGVGHYRSGRLKEIIAKAERYGVAVLSENAFLRKLGMLAPIDAEPRPFTDDELLKRSGLSSATLTALTLFDIIEPQDGRYSFRDLRACRDLAQLIEQRDPAEAVTEALVLREAASFRRHLVELPLGKRCEACVAQLALGDEPDSFEELWDAALAAQLRHDHVEAAETYRHCLKIRPRDPQCMHKLAFALAELGEDDEARALLRKAVTLKPGFADALYELAVLSEGRERMRLLQRTLAAKPDHLAAVHQLAVAHTECDEYDEALPLWERFLALASARSAPPLDPKTRDHAKKALLLCRMVRLRAKGSKP